MKRSKKETPDVALEPEKLTDAALNSAITEVKLGSMTFKVYHLPYRDYLEFLRYAMPLLELVVKKIFLSRSGGVSLPGGIDAESANFSAADVVTLCLDVCGDQLPRMAHIVCRQSHPSITVEEIEALCQTPFELIEVVKQQIIVNNMIKDFKDFLAQMISTLTMMGRK